MPGRFYAGDLSPPSLSSPGKAHPEYGKTAAFLDNNWKSFSSSSLIPFSTKVCGDASLSSLGEFLESYRG